MISIEAEERCGHLITTEVKKMWNVQLGCLEELKRICKKHDIQFFASSGTMLGAVRHQGFIPWDDDIDVFMLQQDYERFCAIAAQEMQEPYFFHHNTTQKGAHFGMARIRNSNTTGCTKTEFQKLSRYENYNCGIFIDIFPLVYVPKGRLKIMWHKLKTKFYSMLIRGCDARHELMRTGKYNFRQSLHKTILLWNMMRPFMSEEKLRRKRNAVNTPCKTGEKVGMLTFFGYVDKYCWPVRWFDELIELPFEDTTIPCPKDYDKILRHQYGDYTVFVKGTAAHTIDVLDPDTPYKEKLQAYYKGAG